jgi:metal-responsive CopG/Arc/MetJ family transcriptional regulator
MPTVPINGTKLLILLEDSVLEKVDRFQKHHKLLGRTQAIRRLIALGLQYAPQEEGLRKYARGGGRGEVV